MAEVDFRERGGAVADPDLRGQVVRGVGGGPESPVRCPATIEPALAGGLDRVALAAFRATGCRDYARVDLRLDARGAPMILEVNPNPDLGPAAGLARAAAGLGWSITTLTLRRAGSTRPLRGSSSIAGRSGRRGRSTTPVEGRHVPHQSRPRGAHREHDRRHIAEVQALFEATFPDLAADGGLHQPGSSARPDRADIPAILLAAHGAGRPGRRGSRWPTTSSRSATATSTSSSPRPSSRGRGLGGALYEALREDLIARGARGLFLEVPTDDPAQVARPGDLKANKDRLKFYERYGALPILGTLYDQPIRPGNPAEPRLLYDPLRPAEPLRADDLGRSSIRRSSPSATTTPPTIRTSPRCSTRSKETPSRSASRSIRRPSRRRTKIPAAAPPAQGLLLGPARPPPRPRARLRRTARAGRRDPQGDRGAARRRAAAGPELRREGRSAPCTTPTSSTTSATSAWSLPEGEMVYPYVFPIRRTDRPPHDRSRRRGLLLHRHVHALEPRRLQGRQGGGQRRALGGRRDRRRRSARLQPLPAPRAPRRARHLRRVLLLLQRGDRRAVSRRAARQGRRPRRRLSPRQRDPGHLLQPIRRPDRLDPRPPELRLPVFLGLRRRDRRGGGRRGSTRTSPCPRTSGMAATSKPSTTALAAWCGSSSPRRWSSRSAWTSPRPTRPARGASPPRASPRSVGGSAALKYPDPPGAGRGLQHPLARPQRGPDAVRRLRRGARTPHPEA